MKVKEKRLNRGYKATNKIYQDAMKQARRDKYPLSNIIEQALAIYGKTGDWPTWFELQDELRFLHS